MPGLTSANTRRGITVLALLLLIIALMVGGFFLVRYACSWLASMQPLDQLNLAGVIEIVSGDAMDLLGVGPHSLG